MALRWSAHRRGADALPWCVRHALVLSDLIVGYPPRGGGVDVAARIVAQGLTEVWGTQNAIVDNRPGATGAIATGITAAAAPDGYTLMLCQIASHAITPARAKKLPYDHVRDFAFVSMVGTTPNVIVTHPSLAMKNLKDVIAYAKKHPGKLNYGSSGVGASPNLSVELLKLTAGIDIVHVPYKGAALAMADVMSGHMELMTGNLPGPLPQIKARKLRGLAVTSAHATRAPRTYRPSPSRASPASMSLPGMASAPRRACRSPYSTSCAPIFSRRWIHRTPGSASPIRPWM